MPFSSKTLAILHQVGWHKNRKIDTVKYVALFESTQQNYSPVVIAFLDAFGDLYTNYPQRNVNLVSHFYIDPIQAADEMSTLSIQRYETKLNTKLCNIGDVDQASILMTPSGLVYSVFDNFIRVKGNSGIEAIEDLCSGP